MLQQLHIQNFKSIFNDTIELGRFNVFIGENGSGKTNILEALGMASAAAENKLSNDELALKGIRVAKPSITFSSFLGEKQKTALKIGYQLNKKNEIIDIENVLSCPTPNDIFSNWILDFSMTGFSKGEKAVFSEVFQKAMEVYNALDNKLPELLKPGFQKLIFEKSKEHFFNSLFKELRFNLKSYKIYHLSTQILRGIGGISREIPGIRGENLDRLIESFDKEEKALLEKYAYFISWLDKIEIDKEDRHKLNGHKLDMSTSILYFRDKYMQRKNNLFSAENANEGVLHILFYLALFISKHTPKLFAIDNIETALNPELCKKLIQQLVKLAKETNRQVLITTHSPAVLDGLNLHDDEQRLFKVYRNKKGHTTTKRIQLKPNQQLNGQGLKLSELWMRNYIGAIPQNL